MTADLFGDWREELIMRTSDNKKLRIWCSTECCCGRQIDRTAD